MSVPPLYAASVPVFLHYLDRAGRLVRRTAEAPERLGNRLAPDMFSGAQQFASAAGFTLRGTLPLIGREIPAFPQADMHPNGLLDRFEFARRALLDLDPADFAGAETRRVTHRAGFADLDQTASEYLHLFALPNFFFHLSMGFAVLRESGMDVGKSDFDGLHDYPPGFRF
ncbi:DUF1993 family protein [Mesobacterium pallidum]|uniref:DUF1993 family protein n=1 Tax=Mesobacterium pallidum TaxID=2872037 RepID=UPI001EE1B38A